MTSDDRHGPGLSLAERLQTWWQLALVTLLGLPLVTPLLRTAVVACTHDGHLHTHRVVAMLHAWRDGLFFSRWLPDLAFGYGYPFFLYREPLPLYLTLFPHLAGLSLPASINLFYVVCILAAGWFTFLWVRDVLGVPAGIVAAVAYMAAPYVLIDALVRGNQVESLALALLPLILWAGRRFVLSGRARWFLVATLGLAALALSHNISLLLFTPALALYLLAVGWMRQLTWRVAVLRMGLVLVLGLGLTAFYTGSALLEMDEVTLTLSTTNRNNDFHFNFASPQEILAPVRAEDPGLLNPPLPLRLGWVPGALALLGAISLLWNRRRAQRGHILLMAGGAVVYLLFSLPITEPLWEALPLIEFVQFPWRFVGRAALPVAFLAGAPFALLGDLSVEGAWRRPLARWAAPVAIAVVLLIVEALPLLYPAYCSEEPFPTIVDVHAYEQNSGMVGVDPVGSYFPITVEERPSGSPLQADYAAGRPPQRFDAGALPEGARLLATEYGPLRARIEVETPQAFEARYLTFAFPGWRVTVDGERVPVTAGDPQGLMRFPVPAGQHTVVVDWGLTPLRMVLGAASLLAGVGIVAAAIVLRRRRTSAGSAETSSAQRLGRRALLLLGALGLGLLAGKVLLVDRVETPLRRTAAPPVANGADVAAGGLGLAGYNLSRQEVPAGGTVDVDLAWQVQASPDAELQSNVWLRGPQGRVWSDRETFRPRTYEEAPSTRFWQPGQWAWDSREVRVLSGTPPGRYDIVLTLFDLADLQPLTLMQGDRALGPTAVIGQIEVRRPETAPRFTPEHPLEATTGGLRLLGYNQDRAEAAPGDPVLLTLFWEKSSGTGSPSTTLPLTLRGPSGDVAQEWTIPPVRSDYAPADWQAGERVRGQHLLRLPASLESGSYGFWLGDVGLGSVAVQAPQRTFSEPAYEQSVDRSFGQEVRLAGFSLDPVSDLPALRATRPPTMTVTLVWEGLQEMERSYHVFVHLVDDAGRIVAQSDAVPAMWTRPTSGWAPGEFVVDRHVVELPAELPAGELALRVGLYEAEAGRRLLLADGGEYVVLLPR